MSEKKSRSTFDEFNRAYESILASLKPFSDQIDQLNKSIELSGFKDRMEIVTMNLEKATEHLQSEYSQSLLNSINSSYTHNEALIKFAGSLISSQLSTLETIAASNNRIQFSLAQLASGISPAINIFANRLDNLANINYEKFIEINAHSAKLLEEFNFGTLLVDIAKVQEDIRYNEFEVADDKLKYDGNTYSYEEIQDIIRSELEEIGFDETNNNFIYDINIKIIQGEKSPFIKLIFIGVIVDLIVKIISKHLIPLLICLPSIILPQVQEKIDTIVDKAATKDQKHTVRTLKKNSDSTDNELHLLKDYRYVTADLLNVREKPSKSSKKMGQLRLGQAVRLIKKTKDWTLVEYVRKDTDGEIVLQGWVFQRYIDKFN